MIRDEWQTWVYMFLAAAAILWTVALFGCAGPEPRRPIDAYRELYWGAQIE